MNLIPTFRFGDIELTSYPFSVRFGKDFGSPEQVVAEVQSALRDGSLTQVTKYENREVSIPVMVEGPDLLALAEAEAILVAEAMKPRNEFVFNPGDGIAFDSVYDTYTANLVPEYDDDHDINFVRMFTLTFDAHPWPRSAEKVVTPAISTGAATVINDGSSTTGWTVPNPVGAVLSTSGGSVINTYDGSISSGGLAAGSLRLTAAVDVSTQPYIAVDWKPSVVGNPLFSISGVAGWLPELLRQPVAAGFTRSWYRVPNDVTALTALELAVLHGPRTGTATLSITQVQKAASLPVSGTSRQLTRAVDPGGSVPAEGTVVVAHPTESLGQCVVYSHRTAGGYSPALRPWLAESDPVIAYSDGMSGSYHALTNLTLFRIPVESVPKGDFQLWARLNKGGSAGSVSVQWVAQSALSTTGGIGDTQEGFTLYNFAAPDTWYMVPLARLTLPVTAVGPAGYVAIGLKAAGVIIDEAWLFAMDEGRLTVVDCGRGTPSPGTASNRLRIAAPSPEEPNGSIMVATLADWSDAYVPPSANILCDQTGHRFDPEGAVVFTATERGLGGEAGVSFEHYPRWHSNAGS